MTDSTVPVGAGGAAESVTRPAPRKKKKRGPNPETKIRKTIRDYLLAQGWFVFPNTAGLGCYPGIADLTAMKNGRTVWIEVKTPKGEQSYEQWEFEQAVVRHGGCTYVIARCVDDIRTLEVE
jgi:Holliday junction resolvase